MTKQDAGTIKGFHAHVYYDPQTRSAAERVREGLGSKFKVQLRSVARQARQGIRQTMYQVAFDASEFAGIVPWLMLNRESLDVLVHPQTGDSLTDHTDHALWLGNKFNLNVGMFRTQWRGE